MALVETSQLVCFLGGTVSIFYSPEAAQMVADKNSKTMWFDLGQTLLGGAVLGGAAAGVGALYIGGKVAYAAAATGAKWSAVGAYATAAGTKLAVGGGINWAVGEVKDLAYEQKDISTSEDNQTTNIADIDTYKKHIENTIQLKELRNLHLHWSAASDIVNAPNVDNETFIRIRYEDN